MKINFSRLLILVVVSFLIGITYNYFSAKGIPLFSFDNKKLLSAELLGGTNEPKHISLKEALKLYDAEVVFFDAREHEDYLTGHIKNAVSIPWDDFTNYKKDLDKIPKDEPVVVYCGGADCDLSTMLGNKLASLGYQNVFVFFGGWNSWTEGKYPVEAK